ELSSSALTDTSAVGCCTRSRAMRFRRSARQKPGRVRERLSTVTWGLVRAVLKRAAGPWQWIEKAPTVILYPEAQRRVRWLTKEEVTRLLHALPPHKRQLTRFALATGLRQANVLGMRWSDVDLDRRTAWVHADEAKGGTAIGIPLNDEAIAVLCEE